ncbi:MAG: GWxTD domain-containing protein [Bacteroidetes bacterium]|nr:GWxTD domain-containing protein [Bacteroidota bacterium]
MKVFFSILSICILLAACSSSKKNNETLANPYIEHDNYFLKDLSLINLSDSVSQLTALINPDKLLYVKNADDKIPSAKYQIRYVLYESYNKKTIGDSATISYTLNKDQTNAAEQKIKFNALKGKNYFLEVIAKDLHRNSQFTIILDLNKKSEASRNYFSATQNNQNIGNNCHVDTNKIVMVQNAMLPNSTVFMKCYFRTFKLPLTPFDLSTPDSFEHKADSTIIFKTDSSGSFSFIPLKKGFYLIQTDTNSAEGFALFHFSREFPYIVHKQQLLEPLAFITSNGEFKALSEAKNSKQAIDNFWEQNCGSKERAKESIKQYYSRVELANQFFTSYREGWRTDRGMIFIIFGPPQLVFRTDEAEKWFYGADNNNMMTEDFTFYKVGNPYSTNAYNLDRATTYKNMWYKMIEAWRDGRIY